MKGKAARDAERDEAFRLLPERIATMTAALTAFLVELPRDPEAALAIAREVGTEDMLVCLGCYYSAATDALEAAEGAPAGIMLERLGLSAYRLGEP